MLGYCQKISSLEHPVLRKDKVASTACHKSTIFAADFTGRSFFNRLLLSSGPGQFESMSTKPTRQEIQAAGHSWTVLCRAMPVCCSQPSNEPRSTPSASAHGRHSKDFTPSWCAPEGIPPPVLSLHVPGAHAAGGSPAEKQSGLQGCALAPSPAVGRWQRGAAVGCGCCLHGRFRAGYGPTVTGIGCPVRGQHCR